MKLTGNSIQKVGEFENVGRNGLNAPATNLSDKRAIVLRVLVLEPEYLCALLVFGYIKFIY